MPEVDASITGFKELSRRKDQLAKSFARNTLKTALGNAAKPVAATAKDLVAVDEGELRDAIGSRASVHRDGEAFALIGFDNKKAPHGGFVELGTSDMQAQPYLRPALEQSRRPILDAFIVSINKTIAKVLKKLG